MGIFRDCVGSRYDYSIKSYVIDFMDVGVVGIFNFKRKEVYSLHEIFLFTGCMNQATIRRRLALYF